jgi:DHA1 family tetracycline resistance protein-like MFS transporter
MNRRKLLTIFVIVFVDLLGFSLILPLVPFYAEEFGASPTVAGLLIASYAAAQLIGAPLLGRLSDRYGRRPVLLVSILGSFVGFGVLGVANSLLILFIARIIDGLTGGNISVAQAYITDITDETNRARGLGLIGAAFGLGFIIGPAMGGFLSNLGLEVVGPALASNDGVLAAIKWQYALPAFAALLVSGLNWLAVFFWLPESLTDDMRLELANRPRAKFSAGALVAAFRRPRVGPLFHVRFFFGLAFATFSSIFPLYAQYRLDLAVDETAYVLAYVGILVALVQGAAIGRLAKRFSESQLILFSSALMTGALIAWALTPNVPVLLIVLIPLALAGGVMNTVVNSALTKSVYPEETGGTLGISAAIESGTRVLAPSMGGLLLGQLGTWAPGIFGAILTAWTVSFVWRRLFVNPDPPLEPRSASGAAQA